MKVKVVKNFRDKYTGERYKAGKALDVTAERFAEINGTSHGVLVKEVKEKKPSAKKKK